MLFIQASSTPRSSLVVIFVCRTVSTMLISPTEPYPTSRYLTYPGVPGSPSGTLQVIHVIAGRPFMLFGMAVAPPARASSGSSGRISKELLQVVYDALRR